MYSILKYQFKLRKVVNLAFPVGSDLWNKPARRKNGRSVYDSKRKTLELAEKEHRTK